MAQVLQGVNAVATQVERTTRPFTGVEPAVLAARVGAVDLDMPLPDTAAALQELDDVFARARTLKDLFKRYQPHHALADRTLVMIFEKQSTRTRLSFEAGMHQHLKTSHAALLKKLEDNKAMDKDAEAELAGAIAAFKKSFA